MTEPDPPTIDPAHALDQVFGEFLRLSGAAPGAEVVLADDVAFGTMHVAHPVFNSVTAARFTADVADARIDEVLGWFRERSMPVGWTVGPRDAPDDLPRRLTRRGLVEEDERAPGMVASLDDPIVDAPPVPGAVLAPIADERDLADACALQAEVFEMPDDARPALLALGRLSLDPSLPIRTFLLRLEGRAVATSLATWTGEAAGIFNVATAIDARRRGFGAAVTRAAMQAGAAHGSRIALLQSSPLGHPVYERLGFRDFGLYRLFVWAPD